MMKNLFRAFIVVLSVLLSVSCGTDSGQAVYIPDVIVDSGVSHDKGAKVDFRVDVKH